MELQLSIKYFIYGLLLLLLQILLFNHIPLGTGMIISVPVLLLLLLPLEVNKITVLLSAFFFGLILDFFSDSLALNTAALTAVAYFRPLIFKIFEPSRGYESGKLPSAFYLGLGKFILISLMATFIFELFYHFFDLFSFKKFLIIFYKSVLTTIFSTSIIIILHVLFFRNK